MRLLCQLQGAQVGNDFMKNNLPGELLRNKLSFSKHSIILYILEPESDFFLSFYFCVYVSVYARAHLSCTRGGQRTASDANPHLLPFVSLCSAVCVHRLAGPQVWGSLPASHLATAAGVTAGHDCTQLCMGTGGLKSGPQACTANP